MPKNVPEEWWHGGDPDHVYDIVGFMPTTGVRIELEFDEDTGQPSNLDPADMLPDGDVVSVLVHAYPKDDPEGGRHFWVHNPMGGTIGNWMLHIQLAAKRSAHIAFELDLPDDPYR